MVISVTELTSVPKVDTAEIWSYLRETATILRRLGEETDRQFKETNRQFKETDRQFKETDKKIKEISVQLGNLGNRLGEFVEEQVLPSALTLIQARGIEVHEVYSRAKAKRSGRSAEIDLLLVNDTDVVAVEVKSTLTIAHIDQHIMRLDEFKTLFTHYSDLHLYGAVAGMVVPDDSVNHAIDQGLFVLIPSADIMRLANESSFQPKVW